LSSGDEDEGLSTTSDLGGTDSDTSHPWMKEFNRYLDSVDELTEDMTIVQWWGVSAVLHHIF
jgi:hypothetical protein